MIGGQAKTQEPEAVYLRDGDVVIMSGKARMSYHAVPKVLPQDFTPEHHSKAATARVDDSGLSADTHNNSASLSTCTKRPCDSNTNSDHSTRKRCKSESEGRCVTDMINSVEKSEFWFPFQRYLSTSRININVRQMFEPGKTAIDYIWPSEDPHGSTT